MKGLNAVFMALALALMPTQAQAQELPLGESLRIKLPEDVLVEHKVLSPQVQRWHIRESSDEVLLYLYGQAKGREQSLAKAHLDALAQQAGQAALTRGKLTILGQERLRYVASLANGREVWLFSLSHNHHVLIAVIEMDPESPNRTSFEKALSSLKKR